MHQPAFRVGALAHCFYFPIELLYSFAVYCADRLLDVITLSGLHQYINLHHQAERWKIISPWAVRVVAAAPDPIKSWRLVRATAGVGSPPKQMLLLELELRVIWGGLAEKSRLRSYRKTREF